MEKKRKRLTLAQKIEKVKPLRPIDDVFFEVLAAESGVLQEMLRAILEDRELIVEPESIVVQSSKRNLYGRSVRLDALCTLGDGTWCNVEVQRSDGDDHLRRVRYNASMITVKESQVGMHFGEVANVCVVYISEKDFIGLGKTIYHIDRKIRETGTIIDDGLSVIFVNATVNDRSEVAELMECFTKELVDDPKFPALSRAVSRLKNDSKGVSVVCSVMEQYMDTARKEGEERGMKQGMNVLANAIRDLRAGVSYEELCKKYDKETADLAKACR